MMPIELVSPDSIDLNKISKSFSTYQTELLGISGKS